MPLIVAIEPDRRQGEVLAGLARGPVSFELIVADSMAAALKLLVDHVPDLILTSLLLSAKDEAALAERLRELDAEGVNVQTIVIPVFASKTRRARGRKGLLTRFRGTPKDALPDGCDPAVFGAQVREYLEHIAADRRAAAAAALEDEQLKPTAAAAPPPVEPLDDDATPLSLEAESDWYSSQMSYSEQDAEPAPASVETHAADTSLLTEAEDRATGPDTGSLEFSDFDLSLALPLSPMEETRGVAEAQSQPQSVAMQDATGIEDAIGQETFERTDPAPVLAMGDTALEPASVPVDTPEKAADPEAADLMAFVEQLEREIAAEATGIDDLGSFDVSNIVDFNLNEWLEEAKAETRQSVDRALAQEASATAVNSDAATAAAQDIDEGLSEFLTAADVVDEPRTSDPAPDAEELITQAEFGPLEMMSEAGEEPDSVLADFLAAVGAPEPVEPLDPVQAEGEEELDVQTSASSLDFAPRLDSASPLDSAAAFETDWADQPEEATQSEQPQEAAPAGAIAPQPETVHAVEMTAPDRPEWLALLSAIRRDIEQLRADLPLPNAASHVTSTPTPKSKKKNRKNRKKMTIREEWGFFDPEQCGFGALVEKLDEIAGR